MDYSERTPTASPDYASVIEPYISGRADSCSYCDLLDPLILQHGTYAYITLAIGQIVEGYLQVCSRWHRTAATGLYQHETSELVALKDLVRDAFQIVYGTPGIAFEHGKAGSCLWVGDERVHNTTELCYHAHIHMVPVDIDIRPRIERVLSKPTIVQDIGELKRVRQVELEARPYLYFEDANRTGFVYPVDDETIPRQFLRTCVAEELGVPERADWISTPGIELFEAGRAKLQPVLASLAAERRIP